jgi:hypothetical protein
MSLDRVPEAQDRPYRRWIEGSGISLEANTPSTPTAHVYYVLQAGVIHFSSADLAEAQEVFVRLGVVHWETLLTSPDLQQRLDGARGLLSHDGSHRGALAVLTADGTDQDRRRIAQARQRALYRGRGGR